AIFSSNPKIAVGVLRDGANDIFRQTIAHRENLPLRTIPATQSVLRASPQLSAAVFKQGKDLRTENFRAGRGNKMVGLKLKKPLVARANPNLLLLIHKSRPRIRSVSHAEILRGICNPVRHAGTVERHPQTAVIIGGGRLHDPRMGIFWRVENFSFNPVQAAAVGSG